MGSNLSPDQAYPAKHLWLEETGHVLGVMAVDSTIWPTGETGNGYLVAELYLHIASQKLFSSDIQDCLV